MSAMETTCFFCQNLLSDFIEGLLHAARHEELKGHLKGCDNCRSVHEELLSTLKLLKNVPSLPLSHELSLRITEAAQSDRPVRAWTRRFVRTVATVGVLAGLVAGASFAFPEIVPLRQWIAGGPEPVNWVRYYPLMQGAQEIVEERANWLQIRDPFSRSLWEEGGLSPEEFEKTFQTRLDAKSPEAAAAPSAAPSTPKR